jgi:hypothetical protein
VISGDGAKNEIGPWKWGQGMVSVFGKKFTITCYHLLITCRLYWNNQWSE